MNKHHKYFLFIVMATLVSFLVAGCATTGQPIPGNKPTGVAATKKVEKAAEEGVKKERKLYVDTGVGYGYNISGDNQDFFFAEGTLKKQLYGKGPVAVDAGGGIIFGETRKDRAVYPMGGVIGEADITYTLNDVFSFYLKGFCGFMGAEPNLFGYSGFLGFGGGELGVEWRKVRAALFIMHISDIPDTKGDRDLNVAGVKFSIGLEDLKGLIMPSSKAPK